MDHARPTIFKILLGCVIEDYSSQLVAIKVGDGLADRARRIATVAGDHDHEVGEVGQDPRVR